MFTKRLLVLVFLPFVLAAFLHSQSVVELAKKEKERREAMKGKAATVVTNAELAKVRKRPSIEPAETAVVEGQTAAQAVREGATPPETEEAAEQAVAAADVQVIPAEPAEPSPQELDAKQNELLEAATEKQEMVDLLALKMNALYQEFYGLDNQKSKELLQLQISDTYDKLLKAEADAAKARKEVEAFIADRKKASTPAIWIK
jgi:hypothetical protein